MQGRNGKAPLRHLIYGAMLAVSMSTTAMAGDMSNKLLLTGGVTQVEGAAGGGLTPWAFIGGYGTDDEIGGNAFVTSVKTGDYRLNDWGALIGIRDRVEISYAQQRFDTLAVGAALGLGQGYTFTQNVWGVKVKAAGDGVLEQDTWMPQIAVGVQRKENNRGALVRALGAKDDKGIDYYIAATKLCLENSFLINTTLRMTKANQMGILGFGGDKHDNYRAEAEISAAYLLRRDLAVGAEYRMKPDNLSFAKEDDWFDVFVAWAPTKNVSLTMAYVDLGDIATVKQQRGIYGSVQFGF